LSYISLHKNQLLDSLENQVLYADLASVILGDDGIGKSFFIEQLHARLAGSVYSVQIDADPQMTLAQFEKTICLQLGLSWQASAGGLIEKIESDLDQRVLVTIDSAQRLSHSMLEFLVSLVLQQFSSRKTSVYFVFVGQASLAEKIAETAALKENPQICVVFELKPFEVHECKNLIAHFQSLDLGTAEALYDEQKQKYFWQLSHGVPGELQKQLERWLEATREKEPVTPKNPAKRQYWLAAIYASLAAILISALIYQKEINQLITPSASTTENPETLSKPGVATHNSALETRLETKADQFAESEKAAEDEKVISEKKGPVGLNINTSERPSESPPESSNEKFQDEITKKLSGDETTKKSKLATVEQEKPVELAGNNVESDTVSDAVSSTKSDPDKSKLTDSSEASLADRSYYLSVDEAALASMDDSAFILQWVGVSRLESAQAFVDKHPLKSSMKIFRRKNNTGYLYLVTSGNYSTRAGAVSDGKRYQKQGYPGKPWVKSAKAVKSEIASLKP